MTEHENNETTSALTGMPSNFRLNELELREGERYDPPEGTLIFQPFKGLTEFWPNDQPQRENWLAPIEHRYLRPLGEAIGRVFSVQLIDDLDYLAVPEEDRARMLSVVLTRSQVQEVRPGIFEWYPICVVVKYFIIAGVKVQLDAAVGKPKLLLAQLWANSQKEYVPVFDHVSGYIENPAVLLQVLEKYAKMEGLS